MRLFRSINTVAMSDSGCVLTIGNFDAVHVGHQKMLKQLVNAGDELGLPVVVMTFAPSPQEYFQKQAAPRLTTISSRYFALCQHRVDMMLALPFNQTLAQTSAQKFIKQYLVEGLNVKYILIGDDFKFGQGRKGDYALLQGAGKQYGFKVECFATVTDSGGRVSSTRIRKLLAEGNLKDTKKLLGRSFTMVGRVIHGDKRGRDWGFPTANLSVNKTLPMSGVFAVKIRGAGRDVRATTVDGGNADVVEGVANLGKRPTIGGMKTLLEVHLFNFDEQIYGRRICVEFIKKIRDEEKFDSFETLQKQIFKDCETARKVFGSSVSTL